MTLNRVSPWMNAQQAADYLGIALGTLRNWTSAKYVPFARRGRVVRYHCDQLDRWLSRGGCNGRTALANAVHDDDSHARNGNSAKQR